MAEFERILRTTISKYARGASNETIQRSVLLSMLKKRGRITYNDSGKDFTWQTKYRQIALVPTSDMEAYTFQRHNVYKTFTLDWRGGRMGDVISEKERLMNRSTEALVNIWKQKAPILKEDAIDQMNKWMYYDGNAAGYTKYFHGIKSIMSYATSAGTSSNYAAGNESYGGQTLNAVHNTESDATAYTPAHINETFTDYGSWTTSPLAIFRASVSATTVKNTPEGRPDIAITTEARFLTFKNALASSERYIVSGDTISELAAGFQGVRYDGVELTWDYDYDVTGGMVAASTLYLNTRKIKLRFLTPQIFVGDSSFDHDRRAYLYDLTTWGNMEINPRYHGQSRDTATAFA